MAPTRFAAYLVGLIAIGSLVVPRGLVYVALTMLAGFAIADAWVSRRLPEIERLAPDLLSRGVASTVTIRPRDGAGGRIEVRQPTPPDLVVDPPQQRHGLQASIVAARRGRHVLPPFSVRATGPLGLGQSFHSIGDETPLSVYPDMPAARRLAAQVRTGLFRTEGLRNRGPVGLGTEFESIRDYVDGDDIRQVNWLATARHSRTMVNQWRLEQDRDVVCVIDAGRLMSAPIGELTRLDAAVDVAAAVGAVADVVGDRVGVVVFRDQIVRQLPARHRGGADLARTIFDIEPEPVDSDYLRAFGHVGGLKRAFVIVLTDLVEDAAARPLEEAIPTLARRHSVAVASVRDPDLDDAVVAIPDDIGDVARAAVALDVLEARRRVVRNLERQGASVIEASPSGLSAGVVAAYLRAKALARF